MTKEQFISSLNEQGIQLTEKQLNQFENYFNILIEWNEKNKT